MTFEKLLQEVRLGKFSEICQDSRKVANGCVFVAIKGFAFDSHSKIASAISCGAAAIVYQKGLWEPSEIESDIPLVAVESTRRALSLLADAFWDHPSGKLRLVGITGTNGKTTTVTLLFNMFTALGYECGMLSTISNRIGKKEEHEVVNTTSDPLVINATLARMAEAGCEFCFMEVSSIGMEQERTAGLEFAAGIFSNLTRDHLDYHGTFAEYLRCKKLFFDSLPKSAVAIVNADDRNGSVMVQNCKAKVVSYGLESLSDHHLKIIEECFDGMNLLFDDMSVWTRLIGRHNAYNLLAAYTTAISLGFESEEVLLALSRVEGAKGRLETIHLPEDKVVVIDYAHTPDALENVLGTLRSIAPERYLVCVFGCGGDRDKGKRPEMGRIAAQMSDRVIVTSDNSRSEHTSDIMADILSGMDIPGKARSLKIEDREEAIRTAILTSPPASTILLAGKGHETYQILEGEKRHFDEREVVAKIIATLNC